LGFGATVVVRVNGLMMFKILILQAWYNLSDEALEKQIARDLMFRNLHPQIKACSDF
jgi:hypothetical protein